MKIEYLDKLGFKEEKLNINNLKISLGSVEFYKKSDNDNGKSSKITTPDLRYYWDEERFGLHMSDNGIDIFTELSNFLRVDNLYDQTEIIYISRCNIYKFNLLDTPLNSLLYLNLSQNQNLEIIAFYNACELKELNASNCPKLKELELNGEFSKIEKLDLANCGFKSLKFEKWEVVEYLCLT